MAVATTTGSSYTSNNLSSPVWLEEVGCDGSESDIGECVDEWGNVSSNCQEHTRDAGVICAGRKYD